MRAHCNLITEEKVILSIDIDSIISAEIVDPSTDPIAYAVVAQFMVHGPYGEVNPNYTCMKDGKCNKHFPKEFQSNNGLDPDGFPAYSRRENERSVEKGSIQLDNRLDLYCYLYSFEFSNLTHQIQPLS